MSTNCPHCQNTHGFVFGTCCNCGYNYLDKTFHFIEVRPEFLPQDIRYALIEIHANKTRRISPETAA